MGATVAKLQQRITSAEFVEWLAFYQGEPWGDLRADLQNAALLCLLANANRDAKRRPQAFKVEDFMMDYWQTPRADGQPTVILAEKFKILTQAAQDG